MATPTDADMLASYKAAEQAIANGAAAEARTADGRVFRALDLDQVRKGIAFYQRRVNQAASGNTLAGGAALGDFT